MSRHPKYLRKRGKVYVFDGRVNGQRHREQLGQDYSEAVRKHDEILERLKTPPSDATTVAVFGRRWLEEHVRQNRPSPTGYLVAHQRFVDYTEPGLGDLPLDQVQIGELRAFRRDIRGVKTGKPLGKQTIKHILSDIRSMLNYAVDCGKLDMAPKMRKVLPKVPEKEPRPLSESQLEAIYEALAPYPHQLFHVKLSRWTGCRLGECHQLRWRDVKWKPKPHIIITKSKSGKVRRIPLFPEAVELLKEEHEGQWESLRVQVGSVMPISTEAGACEFVSPYRLTSASNIHRRSSLRLGWHWNFHQLRDTFACWFLDTGGRLEELQAILGHSTIEMTQKYAKLSDRAVFEAVERISRANGQENGQRRREVL